MICRKCGVKNKDTRTRCFHCGASLEKKPITSTPSPEIAVEPSTEENTIHEIVVEPIIENSVDKHEKQETVSVPIVEIPEIIVEPIAEETISETDPIKETTEMQQGDEEISDTTTVVVEENEAIIEEVPAIEDIETVIEEAPTSEVVETAIEELPQSAEEVIEECIPVKEVTESVEEIVETDKANEETESTNEAELVVEEVVEEYVPVKEVTESVEEIVETDKANEETESTSEAELVVEEVVDTTLSSEEESIINHDENESLITDNEESTAEENNEEAENTDDAQIPAIEVEKTDEDSDFTKKSNKKKLLWLLIIPILAVVLIILLVINPFKKAQPATPTLNVYADNDGNEYVHAVFYGKPGEKLKLNCNGSTYTFESDQIVLDLYLKDLLPADYIYNNSTVDINLQAYYVSENETYCETPIISLNIPTPETDITSDTKEIYDYDEFYNLCFAVEDGAKATLNGEELVINSLGIINHQISIPAEGGTFELKIEKEYHRPFTKKLIFKKEDSNIDLTISSEVSEVHSGTEITINYIASEGAQIISNLPVKSLVTGQTPGSYDVVLDISSCEYGIIEAAITAKIGDSSLRKSITFKYWPSEDELLATATMFNETVLTEPEYNKNYTFDSVTFSTSCGINKVIGSVQDTELTFDISGLSGEIQPETVYDAVGTLVEEDGKPIFKLWYAAPPQESLPEDELEETPETEITESVQNA